MSAWRHIRWVTAQTACLTHPTLMTEPPKLSAIRGRLHLARGRSSAFVLKPAQYDAYSSIRRDEWLYVLMYGGRLCALTCVLRSSDQRRSERRVGAGLPHGGGSYPSRRQLGVNLIDGAVTRAGSALEAGAIEDCDMAAFVADQFFLLQ